MTTVFVEQPLVSIRSANESPELNNSDFILILLVENVLRLLRTHSPSDSLVYMLTGGIYFLLSYSTAGFSKLCAYVCLV